jgi:hypothetical protein
MRLNRIEAEIRRQRIQGSGPFFRFSIVPTNEPLRFLFEMGVDRAEVS